MLILFGYVTISSPCFIPNVQYAGLSFFKNLRNKRTKQNPLFSMPGILFGTFLFCKICFSQSLIQTSLAWSRISQPRIQSRRIYLSSTHLSHLKCDSIILEAHNTVTSLNRLCAHLPECGNSPSLVRHKYSISLNGEQVNEWGEAQMNAQIRHSFSCFHGAFTVVTMMMLKNGRF